MRNIYKQVQRGKKKQKNYVTLHYSAGVYELSYLVIHAGYKLPLLQRLRGDVRYNRKKANNIIIF